ncbi:hypothetical protein N0002_31090 [Pseudomonas aeruginosa]|uniref:hypothetical protein n=1 Tax=Pseudomonas TaxID=286 RepID=UPI000F509458|nr:MULTISPECIES: hypothetical protein [Pseudomonas]HCL2593215.1 hypothetical protein [Pseudomonas aeruginosa C40A]EIU3185543.1 hypothetical protein [Pseudomonas aeruginosa]EIU3231021.1 hypothetical protein [Pseudomonas aeruginosa]EIU3244208.1 hypothetical protein [Pseudomonas aeruginosa]EIU7191975.1 hypothetical protein [Pseudomonas aeruginosa]
MIEPQPCWLLTAEIVKKLTRPQRSPLDARGATIRSTTLSGAKMNAGSLLIPFNRKVFQLLHLLNKRSAYIFPEKAMGSKKIKGKYRMIWLIL